VSDCCVFFVGASFCSCHVFDRRFKENIRLHINSDQKLYKQVYYTSLPVSAEELLQISVKAALKPYFHAVLTGSFLIYNYRNSSTEQKCLHEL
jgi:hypothetical protein